MEAGYVWTLAVAVFGVELLMVGVLTLSARRAAGRGARGWAAALGAGAVVVALWALFAAPTPIIDVAPVKFAVKVVLFAAAASALWLVLRRANLAVVFAVAALVLNVAAILPPYNNYGGFDVPS